MANMFEKFAADREAEQKKISRGILPLDFFVCILYNYIND